MVIVKEPERTGHDVIIGFRPIPPALEKIMRTVAADRDTAESLDVAEYARRAARVLAEIRAALDDHEGFEGSLSSLGVSEDLNTVTGAHGLILRRRLRDGRYSAQLGEIFSDTGRLDDEGIERFDRFRYDAYRHGLKLWIHQSAAGEGVVHNAFAVASEAGNSTTFWFLARLLVTPFELEQWRPILDGER